MCVAGFAAKKGGMLAGHLASKAKESGAAKALGKVDETVAGKAASKVEDTGVAKAAKATSNKTNEALQIARNY